MKKCFRVKAIINNLDAILEKIDEDISAHFCPSRIKNLICISVEEIFTNIASYSYEAEDGDVEISYEILKKEDHTGIKITFKDWGVPYNPLKTRKPDFSLPIEERPIGGLGVYMVQEFMDTVEYHYQDGCNILKIARSFKEAL